MSGHGWKVGRVSREAIRSLGVEGFAVAAVVEFAIAPGEGAGATLAEMLNEATGLEITTAQAIEALRLHPVTTGATK